MLSRELSPSQRKHWAWMTRKVCLYLEWGPVTTALYEARETCRLHLKRSEKLATARDGECAALRAAILSGIPNVRIALFVQCSVSARDTLPEFHSRRTREIPLAREDIPDSTLRCVNSAPPPGPDVISNFQSLRFLT